VGVTAAPRRAAISIAVLAVVMMVLGSLLGAIAFSSEAWARRLSLDAGPAFSRDVLLVGGGFLVVWAAAAACTARSRPAVTITLAAALAPGLYVSVLTPLTAYAEHRSARDIARHIDPDAEVIAFRTFRTSLPFYLGQPVTLASTTGRELTSNYVTAHADRFFDQGTLVHPTYLWERLADIDAPVYVLTTHHKAGHVADKSSSTLEAVCSDRRSVLLANRQRDPKQPGPAQVVCGSWP